MLSRIIMSDVPLPPEISTSVAVKLFYHLVIHALKENNVKHLLSISHSLVDIIREARKSNETESTGLSKQISDHLWNTAIRLSKKTEKQETASLALSIREHSIDLLMLTKSDDLRTIVERGLSTACQFEKDTSQEREEGKQFLLRLLNKVITLVEEQQDENLLLNCRIDDFCILCYKTITSQSHLQELIRLFNQLNNRNLKKKRNTKSKNHSTFHGIICILLCALSLRVWNEGGSHDWNLISKQLNTTTESLRNMDPNVYANSVLLKTIMLFRIIVGKTVKGSNGSSDDTFDIPPDVVILLYNLLLVTYSVYCAVIKTKLPSDQLGLKKETYACERQALLFLISSLLRKMLDAHGKEALENGRYNMLQQFSMCMNCSCCVC